MSAVRNVLQQRRLRIPPTPIPLRCDRCGHEYDRTWLHYDGLGLVCPPCRIGGALARGEAVG